METKLDNDLIWFVAEDLNHANELHMTGLLEESFSKWHSEIIALLANTTGVFVILDKDGNIHTASDEFQSLHMQEISVNALLKQTTLQAITNRHLTKNKQLSWQVTAIPLVKRSDETVFAVFAYLSQVEEHLLEATVHAFALHYRSCFYCMLEQSYTKRIAEQEQKVHHELKKREALLLASRHMSNQIDVSGVLGELLHSVEMLFDSSEAYLYLSQDHVHGDVRIRPLVFDMMTDNIITEAFLNGKTVHEQLASGQLVCAVPLSGKQASYGILQIIVQTDRWNEEDLQIVRMLADMAGSAFENAKLYEQSNMLIKELRLINEMTKRLNQSLRLKDILHFAITEMLSIFQADFCCVMQLNKEKDTFEVMSSNVTTLSRQQYSINDGFTGIVYRTKEPLIISDYNNTATVASPLMERTKSRSLIASPIFVDGEVIGAILIAHRIANYFSYENYKLLQVISTHVGLAIVNASLHAEVRRMVITDNLTGLHARHYLNEQIQLKQRFDNYGSLILVDIDYFKQVNDTFGHQIGDQILIQVSDIVKTSIRSGDIAARWGGEELAVYLPMMRVSDAVTFAEIIRKQVEEQTNPQVTVSCGVSEWLSSHQKISVESLFYKADMALYEAKHEGRNRIVVDEQS
ncbi:diguanylate cyclase [Paenibacillus yanchengensis]|uniref:Diguanylate cyclase n=1 Tax=Paenibacillus yanchengensis TaxID=2035833 RepID=A0ABW4YMW6_9BACL